MYSGMLSVLQFHPYADHHAVAGTTRADWLVSAARKQNARKAFVAASKQKVGLEFVVCFAEHFEPYYLETSSAKLMGNIRCPRCQAELGLAAPSEAWSRFAKPLQSS